MNCLENIEAYEIQTELLMLVNLTTLCQLLKLLYSVERETNDHYEV
jgi:hypothetical protein